MELARLKSFKLPCFVFYEPDLGGELTSIAIGPLRGRDRKRMKKYKLLEKDTT